MRAFICDACGAIHRGYFARDMNPIPRPWLRRQHVGLDGKAHTTAEIVACSVVCSRRLDKALNVPYFVDRWTTFGEGEDGAVQKCRTDDARPLVPVNLAVPRVLDEPH